jgi:hypothetical protein
MKTFDLKLQTDLVILDFSKAFDAVPHKKLLHKLNSYGINGTTHKWIGQFLTVRKHQVVIDGERLRSCSVHSGVPQGTVLGPLLFLCYINDLPSCVISQVRLFADDCLLYRSIKSINDQIHYNKIYSHSKSGQQQWGMRFNATKCYLMTINITKNPLTFDYTLDSHNLEKVTENPYLGITISDNLKWNTNINKISNKASSMLGFIRRNLRHCTSSLKQTAYASLIRSVMYSSCVVWDPYLRKDIDKLENIQRRAVRFVKIITAGIAAQQPCFRTLKWQPLADRRRDQRLILLYKIINGLVEIPADQHIQPNPRPSRNRHTKTLLIHTCNTDIYKHLFIPRSTIDWNSLPETTITNKTVDIFKAALLKRD